MIAVGYPCLFYLVYKVGKRKKEAREKHDHSKEDDTS
jgi:hypothetical protein